ncbi:G-protein coupled receptor 1-like [Protopterus annectens]|uniref:G-protein coupled receptor 1-like n=1 Tax=Protopterus annectens TaxID=7888 RepID=UPI001CF96ABF|nr:G-protein coupled receptor 1-like [Protopterus annectens]
MNTEDIQGGREVYDSYMNYTVLDYSQSTLPSVLADSEDSFENMAKVVSAIMYTIAFVCGVTGNALVLWNIGFKLKKTVTLIYILNLALSDFILTALLPFSIINTALDYHWPFGTFMCKFLDFVAHLNMFANVFLLMLVSSDRYISIVHPVWAQNHRSLQKSILVCVLVWSVAIAFSIPFAIIRETQTINLGSDLIVCYSKPDKGLFGDNRNNKVTEASVRFVIAFLIPFITIAFCYGAILVKLKHKWTRPSRKPFKVITAVVIAFFICWLPYHILNIIKTFPEYSDSAYTLSFLAKSLAYFNSCINPILFIMAGRGLITELAKKMKDALQGLLQEEMGRRQSKSEKQSSTTEEVSCIKTDKA